MSSGRAGSDSLDGSDTADKSDGAPAGRVRLPGAQPPRGGAVRILETAPEPAPVTSPWDIIGHLGWVVKHYRWAGSPAVHSRRLLFEVKLDLQDVRSGQRFSETLHLKAEWLPDGDLEWSRDMVAGVDAARLEEIEAPGAVPAPSGAVAEKLISYLVRHHRLEIFRNYELGLYSAPAETRPDFVERCREALREEKESEMKKLREVFLHRFFEFEQKLKSEIRDGDLDRELKTRVLTRLDELFSEGRDGLSRWFVRESDLIGEHDLVWKLKGDPEFQERIDALRADLAARFNEISSKFEEKAASVEQYQIPIQRSAIDVIGVGILWE